MQENAGSIEKDINSIFDDVLFIEDRFIKNSYKKGCKIGQEDGNIEAYHLGYHRGAELGAEIGYITGITDAFLSNSDENQLISEKVTKILVLLKNLLSTFPNENDTEIDILELANKIRGLFKKVCALLKIEPDYYKQIEKLSF